MLATRAARRCSSSRMMTRSARSRAARCSSAATRCSSQRTARRRSSSARSTRKRMHLVVTDMVMPGMSGVELAREHRDAAIPTSRCCSCPATRGTRPRDAESRASATRFSRSRSRQRDSPRGCASCSTVDGRAPESRPPNRPRRSFRRRQRQQRPLVDSGFPPRQLRLRRVVKGERRLRAPPFTSSSRSSTLCTSASSPGIPITRCFARTVPETTVPRTMNSARVRENENAANEKGRGGWLVGARIRGGGCGRAHQLRRDARISARWRKVTLAAALRAHVVSRAHSRRVFLRQRRDARRACRPRPHEAPLPSFACMSEI